jgi:hypothetical protein
MERKKEAWQRPPEGTIKINVDASMMLMWGREVWV